MKISNIEVFDIEPKIRTEAPDYPAPLSALHKRVVFKVTIDNGVVGYGEYRTYAPDKKVVEPLIGRNLFDFINHDLNIGMSQWCLGLSAALYDAMGKCLEIPAYKLMGTKVRDRVAVSAWTRPVPPDQFAKQIERAVDQGYHLLKMHTAHQYDIYEQTKAAEQVAPHRFRIQYDLNHNRTIGVILPILKRLEKSWVVGCVEDPLVLTDIDGWRRLREQTEIPIYMHVPPLGGFQELLHGLADGYVICEYSGGFGDAIHRGFAYSKANIPSVIQLTGGSLITAFALHLGAVLPRVAHTITLDDNYEEDLAKERIPVIEGCSPVPEGPGLGVEVDEDKLHEMAAREPYKMPRVIGVTRFSGGNTLYTVGFPKLEEYIGYEEGAVRGHTFNMLEDDGSEEFNTLYERAANEGSFFE
ncbi:MAG: enolase C-terminal domain-like protein [Candidatus Latescibacterota bacterium]|nr:enolase C-terminal domain-like protein [Candidatus Latescibacterota bacterium]